VATLCVYGDDGDNAKHERMMSWQRSGLATGSCQARISARLTDSLVLRPFLRPPQKVQGLGHEPIPPNSFQFVIHKSFHSRHYEVW